MKIRFADATGCPFGQFVVTADTEEEKAIMRLFLKGLEARPLWKFWLHGYAVRSSRGESFNFGWIEDKENNRVMKTETLRAIAGVCCIVVTVAVCAFVGIKSSNDGSIARDTARIAEAAERGYPMPKGAARSSLDRCGKVLSVQGMMNGVTLAPSAFMAVEEDETKRTFQLKLSGVWKEGMRACGTPL